VKVEPSGYGCGDGYGPEAHGNGGEPVVAGDMLIVAVAYKPGTDNLIVSDTSDNVYTFTQSLSQSGKTVAFYYAIACRSGLVTAAATYGERHGRAPFLPSSDVIGVRVACIDLT